MAKTKRPEYCAYFSIKNFSQYQHYKNRNPPWVKLHYAILDDEEFLGLDLVSQRNLMVLFMVAGKKDNRISNDPTYLKRVLRLDAPPDLNPLFRSGWLLALDASRLPAYPNICRRQNVPPKAEAELSEAEAEAETDNSETDKCVTVKNGKYQKPEGVPEKVWSDFVVLRKAKDAPITETAIKGIQREANKAGFALGEALTICCERGWQGFKAEWVHEKKNGSGYKTNFDRTLENAKKVMEGLHDD